MFLQRTCQALLALSFVAACVVVVITPGVAAPALSLSRAAGTGLAVGYIVPAVAFLAAPRLRRHDLALATVLLAAAMTLFHYGLNTVGLTLCVAIGVGSLALLAPVQIGAFRRYSRSGLARANPTPERRQRQPQSLRAVAIGARDGLKV